MPGKLNPVVCEALMMAAAQVVGCDATITLCGAAGNVELNVMVPVMTYDLLQSIQLIAAVSRIFADRYIAGLDAETNRCRESIERNLAISTFLVPRIGYDKSASISREAYLTGRTVRELVQEWKVLPEEELERLLDIRLMTEPGLPGKEIG